MKKISILALFIIISFTGMSQDVQPVIDNYYYELHSALKNSDSDSASVKNLNKLAGYHKFSRPDSGIYYATKGFELAQEIGDKKQELIAIESLATSYLVSGNSVTAYRIGLEGLRKAEEYDSDQKAYFYRILGIIMRSSQNFEESLEYDRKAKAEFYRINNQGALATIYGSLGVIHSELGNIDSAFYYGYRAVALGESITNNSLAYSRLGDIHRDIQNIDSALYYYKLSNEVRLERRRNPVILRKIAYIYTLKEQPDSALYYAEESLNRAVNNRLYEDISESALFFSEFYENSDPSKAITYYKMALAYNDSLEFMNKMTGFADLTNFDELLRQTELERANEAYKSKLRTNTFIGSIFTLSIIAFFLYRNNLAKHKSKLQIEGAYNQLKSTQAQLIQSEKMASLGELTAGIAHEIQNPLNFVNNFSEVSKELIQEMREEINSGDIDEAKIISKEIEENLEKINHHGKRADSIVKGMLLHSRTSKGEKVPTDINALCDEFLRLSYHGLRARDRTFNADFEMDFDESIPKIEVVPQDIGRVLLNLYNNAFQACADRSVGAATIEEISPFQNKSSLSGQNPLTGLEEETDGKEPVGSPEESKLSGTALSGVVKVQTKNLGDKIEITVSDNGPGIPDYIKDKIFQPFFTTKPTGQGTGLGLSLAYDIVKAHGGELTVECHENEGTDFTIKLSLS